jgi:hypothetical protein
MQLRNENSYGRLKDTFDWNLVDATPSLQTLTGAMVLKVVSLHLKISRAPGNAKPELFVVHCILAFDCYEAAGHPAAASTLVKDW